MLYTLDLGAAERDIAKQAKRSGQPIPDRILNAPQLIDGLEMYLQAFFDLDSERQIGFGSVGRIPWSKVQEYATFYQLDELQTESLHYFIRAMDAAHLKRMDDSKPKGK